MRGGEMFYSGAVRRVANAGREQASMSLVIGVCLSIMLILILAAWCRMAVVRTEYAISEGERALRVERDAVQALQIEEASLRRPERIARIAQQELGLVRPGAGRIVTVQKYEGP